MEHITEKVFEEFVGQLGSKESGEGLAYRKRAFSHFMKTAMPSFKYGLTILIRPIFSFEECNPALLKESAFTVSCGDADSARGVSFLQTKNYSDLSSEELELFTREAWVDPADNNKLFYFHQAFANDILFINIPKKVELKDPIHIELDVSKISQTVGGAHLSQIFVLGGEGSKAKIVLEKRGGAAKEGSGKEDQKIFCSEAVRIVAKKNSVIDFVTLQHMDLGVVNVERRKAYTERDAQVNWVELCLGSSYTKTDVVTTLGEKGADTNNTVLYFGKDDQRYDIYTASLHSAAHTSSNIVTKGVLGDKAKGLSRGLVMIGKEAEGSNGYEKQDALLLSEKAEADAIPNLEIHNHEVKCSHGSTVGQLDKDKLFYLMSRGLSEEEAKKKIVEGYFMPVMDLFEDSVLRGKIEQAILAVLS